MDLLQALYNVFRTKLKGGALYIALIISIVIGIVLSAFILIAYFNQRQVLSRLALAQLQLNLRSGLAEAHSGAFSELYNNKWQALPFNDDSIRIKKLQWGAFEAISVESKNRIHYLKDAGLYGVLGDRDTAILIVDKGRPVSLGGLIKLNGGCYFPNASYKAISIDGESFTGDRSINTFLRKSPALLPTVNEELRENLKKSLQDIDPNIDSLTAGFPTSGSVDFSLKTVVIQAGELRLNDRKFSGNIKLVADEVLIGEHCTLNNVLIVASLVRIKRGFTGSVHIIARDSIILERGCVLNYPSSLTILNAGNDVKRMAGIFLDSGCVVHGSLLALHETNNKTSVIVKLGKNCEVYGLIYSENYAQIQGKVFGTTFCESLLLVTPSSAYENHLFNCELDPKKFAHTLVIPSVFKTHKSYRLCKWL